MMGKIMKVIFGMLLVVVGIIYSGHALTVLWDWFMVPAFSLPSLPIAMAIGVRMVVAAMAGDVNDQHSAKDGDELLGRLFTTGIIVPTVQLFVGYIVTLFV
jgi:hypothetical protein